MPTWLLLSLLAAFVWTLSPIFLKKGYIHISSLWNNIFANIFTLIIWVPAVLLLSHGSLSIPSFQILCVIAVAGSAYMFYFYALSKADISLTAPLSALYPISTITLSYVFLHERVSIMQAIGIIIAITGVFLIALPQKKLGNIIKTNSRAWLWWGLFSAIISGSGDFLSKVASNAVGAYSQIFYLAIIAQVLSIGNFLIDKKGRTLPTFSLKKFLPTLLGTSCSILGMFFFLLAFKYGKASLVVPVSSTYPALVVVFAAIFLRERVSLRQTIGVILITIGVMFIGFGG